MWEIMREKEREIDRGERGGGRERMHMNIGTSAARAVTLSESTTLFYS